MTKGISVNHYRLARRIVYITLYNLHLWTRYGQGRSNDRTTS
jgi:hypothetical protein